MLERDYEATDSCPKLNFKAICSSEARDFEATDSYSTLDLEVRD
jgi:hypothetical protein